MSAIQATIPRVYLNTTLAMGNEEHPGPTKTPPPPPPQGRNIVNLSDLYGQTSASNYVGITKKDPSGKGTTSIEVRMQAVIDRAGDLVTVKEIRAIGPFVKKDGKLTNERFKSYVITDTAGRPITDPASARSRVITMLKNDGMTLVSPEDRQRTDAAKAERRAQADKIRASGATVVKAPNMEYSKSADQPNRLLSNAPKPNEVRRFGTNISWQDNKKGEQQPTITTMIVPNIVTEVGVGKTGFEAKITPQPATVFVPYTTSNGESYRQTSNNHTLARTTFHPAGFYPGDPNAASFNNGLAAMPELMPEFRTSNYGHSSSTTTENFSQLYANWSDLRNPANFSVNARSINGRIEARTAVFTGGEITNGKESSNVFAAPYTWTQFHTKLGIGDVAVAPAPYAKVGFQGEIGVYVASTTSPLTNPFDKPDKKSHQVQDWHIINGSVSTNKNAFLSQFSSIVKPTGLNILSESIVPSWGDRSAGVYVQVPRYAHGGTPAWEATKAKALFFSPDGHGHYVSLNDMTSMLNKIGKESLKHKEFKFIDSGTLKRLNPDALKEVIDSRTGRKVLAFPADSWMNTGARVSIGGPGLFLPKDVNIQKAR